jgi:hypothetical protein
MYEHNLYSLRYLCTFSYSKNNSKFTGSLLKIYVCDVNKTLKLEYVHLKTSIYIYKWSAVGTLVLKASTVDAETASAGSSFHSVMVDGKNDCWWHWSLGVKSMLEHLKWPTLEERRKRAKVTMLYRIIHQVVAIPVQPYLIPRSKTGVCTIKNIYIHLMECCW